MSTRRSTRKAAQAASQTLPPLDGCHIAISGTFPGLTQQTIKSQLDQLGAVPENSVTDKTTHLIASQADYDKPSAKVKTSIAKGIHIVQLQWLQDCQVSGNRKSEQPYLVGGSVPAKDATAAQPTKRAASFSPDEPSNDGQPNAKKRKTTVKRNSKAKIKAKAITKANSDSDLDPDPKPEPESNPASQSKSNSKPDSKPRPFKSKAQTAKSAGLVIPLDEGCTLLSYAVYIDEDGNIWDASLNQTNASHNNNKFYRIQVLRNGADFKVWTRWGRVGERGQTAILGHGAVEDALRQFRKKFRDKSGLSWEDRTTDPIAGKYAFVERSYQPDSDEEGGTDDSDSNEADDSKHGKDQGSQEPLKCTLELPVQRLIELIFNQKYFAATMSDLNYDANKLPLGKLSKATITRGFQALKELAALLDRSAPGQGTFDSQLLAAVERQSNLYYSLIPHAFGRRNPPVIQEQTLLKKEIELLESLGDMKDAELLMKADRVKAETVHPLDRHYQALGMEEMTILDPATSEYMHLVEYLMQTRGATHGANYVVESVFRIERRGELDRFNRSAYAGPPRGRKLLWHGSRVTNFGGILSQGLRIAPPEAPVSGYMFGKGIYLADMSSKSANYCCAYSSGSTALLLLCEAELGDPMLELIDSSYSAGEDAKAGGKIATWGQGRTGPTKWKDAECVHSSLAGVMMPDVSVQPGNTSVDKATLMYNEYIAYDVDQIRLRYLFRVKM